MESKDPGGGGTGNGGGGDMCQPSGGGGNGNGNGRGGGNNQERHEVFGDTNLGFVMMFLLLLHLLQYSMRDPCTC